MLELIIMILKQYRGLKLEEKAPLNEFFFDFLMECIRLFCIKQDNLFYCLSKFMRQNS